MAPGKVRRRARVTVRGVVKRRARVDTREVFGHSGLFGEAVVVRVGREYGIRIISGIGVVFEVGERLIGQWQITSPGGHAGDQQVGVGR